MDKLTNIDNRHGVFVLDGVSSNNFNLFVNGSATYSAPARSTESVQIPGKNGALVYDDGSFTNLTISYSASILQDFSKSIANFKSFYGSRKGYVRLEDSYNPDYYRMVYCDQEVQVEAIRPQHGGPYGAGNLTIAFNAKPQLYYKSGERAQDCHSGDTLFNPSYLESHPLITVYATGTYHIGDYTFTVNSLNGTDSVTIDSELQDCYHDLTNMNPYVTIDTFPTLKAGTTGLQFDSDKITITPRWWTL